MCAGDTGNALNTVSDHHRTASSAGPRRSLLSSGLPGRESPSRIRRVHPTLQLCAHHALHHSKGRQALHLSAQRGASWAPTAKPNAPASPTAGTSNVSAGRLPLRPLSWAWRRVSSPCLRPNRPSLYGQRSQQFRAHLVQPGLPL